MDRMVRVYDPDDDKIGSEVIQLQMDTLPPTNIFGVYQETGKSMEEVEITNRVLRRRVTECEARGQNIVLMEDFNAPLNFSDKPFISAAKKILDWEESEK